MNFEYVDFDLSDWKKLPPRISKATSSQSCYLSLQDAYNFLVEVNGNYEVQPSGMINALFSCINNFKDDETINVFQFYSFCSQKKLYFFLEVVHENLLILFKIKRSKYISRIYSSVIFQYFIILFRFFHYFLRSS
jgi:hypothetical protein